VRERFILNTEAALRAQLTEFRDHEVVKVRPGGDGGEVMYIPLAPDNLRAALEQLEAGEGAAGGGSGAAAAAGGGG
jgi:origin recognition complex subunit 2